MHNNEFYHHGIKGQRWGVRRFQNPDGSLTPLGKARARSPETQRYFRKAVRLQRKGNQLEKRGRMDEAKEFKRRAAVERNKERISQELDETAAREMFAHAGKTFVYSALLIGDEPYRYYVTNRVAGVSKGKAFVRAMTIGDYGVRDKWINERMNSTKKSSTKSSNSTKQNNSTAKSPNNSNQNSSTTNLTTRFNQAKKEIPNLSYDKIYRDMNVDMTSEDPDDYRWAENEWLKKHGY